MINPFKKTYNLKELNLFRSLSRIKPFEKLNYEEMALFLPHQIAGPIYKIEKELERLAEGDFTHPVRLRENDEFQELSEGINILCDEFKGLIAKADQLSQAIESKDSPSRDENIKQMAEDIKSYINRYKL